MPLVSRPLYRTRQFIAALRPHVDEAESSAARTLLGPELSPLFDSMTPRDRRHSLDVYGKLLDTGCEDADTLAAALLHDSGKGRLSGVTVRLWHRVAYVVLDAAAPTALRRLSRSGSGLSVLRRHPEIGARLAQSMGASPKVVQMIRDHERVKHDDSSLAQLRAADDDS
ncbi:MAG: hypothetical protein IH957_08215 [Chloroflexi bacterium]|nr:hypothetical protein [Chloroflexota bacterium]